MSINAFHTRRVLESLTALGGYLEQAVKTAEGIPPGEVPGLDLPEQPPVGSSPRLISVLHEGSRKITLPNNDTDDGITTLELVVSGDDLENPKLFKLVGVGPDAQTFGATAIGPVSADGDTFTATMEIKEPSAGLYDAKFVNNAGQQDVLNRAFRIKKAPEDGGDTPSGGGWAGGGSGSAEGNATGSAAFVVEESQVRETRRTKRN